MRAFAILLPLLFAAAQAHALDEAATLRLLDSPVREPGPCALVAPWGPPADGIHAAAVVVDEDYVRLALVREQDGAPVVVAGPIDVPVIRIDPLNVCSIALDGRQVLGGRPLVTLRVRNHGLTTGRSSSTQALVFVLREGNALRMVFSSLTEAQHSEQVGRRRLGWHFTYSVEPAAAPAGRMPDMVVRDLRSGRVMRRARWRGNAYSPDSFEHFGPFRG